MGLCINYSGSFNRNASLSKMINEVRDIVEACNWKYYIYNKEFPIDSGEDDSYDDNIYGISFTPPECETVSLCFLSNHKLSSYVNLLLYGETKNKREQEYLYLLPVKTQFAGEEIHKFIIELFRYLKKQNYFEELEIYDEGEYWETGDEKILHENFKKYDYLLDSVSLAIQSIPKNEGESYEDYFNKLMQMIINKNRN